jgi:RNA-directed DNA polymerase
MSQTSRTEGQVGRRGDLDNEAAAVNGLEGEVLDWWRVDWRNAEDNVRRLRQRIFTATRAGDLKTVRSLQKLMLRSRSNALVSVRRVTEINAGRKTAGIDGKVALVPDDKASLVDWAQLHSGPWKARPVKRVYIPKADGRQRPLGIPVIMDRVRQAQVVNALEPEWEAKFEPKSYGFRPGRGCHDAIEAIFNTACGKHAKRLWVLDADLEAAFDKIDHDHLLGALTGFPARGLIRQWLKSGVAERGILAATEWGTPQGGVVSPLLLNIALHGLEEAAGVRYGSVGTKAGTTRRNAPLVIRYADDLLALCHSRQQAEDVKSRLVGWLAARGLRFNEAKTRMVHLDEGVDFLGFTARRHGGKLLITPSKAAQRRIRNRLRTEMRSLRGANASAVLYQLNPIIRGWSAYYRTVVSSKTFAALDHYVWTLTFQWATRNHRNKPKHWIVDRYFGRFHATRHDRWTFGNRDSGAYLLKFAWTKIVRHQQVQGTASPDDPALADYWATRRRRRKPPLSTSGLRLLKEQHGRCPRCGDLLLHADREPQSPEEWEQWARATRKAITKYAIVRSGDAPTDDHTLRLIHAHCTALLHRQP